MNGNESKESASLLRRGLKALAGLGFGSPETDTPTSQAATLGAYTRDSKILDIFEGTQQIQQLIIARRVLGKSSADLK